MSDHITIEGVKPYDGRYDLDIAEEPLTIREWGWIKKFAGYLPATLGENWISDPEFQSVLAIVALHRNSVIEPAQAAAVWERFQDVPYGSAIRIELGVAEDDAAPPLISSTSSESFDGDSSMTSSATSEPSPEPTGDPLSDTSASAPMMSVS